RRCSYIWTMRVNPPLFPTCRCLTLPTLDCQGSRGPRGCPFTARDSCDPSLQHADLMPTPSLIRPTRVRSCPKCGHGEVMPKLSSVAKLPPSKEHFQRNSDRFTSKKNSRTRPNPKSRPLPQTPHQQHPSYPQSTTHRRLLVMIQGREN